MPDFIDILIDKTKENNKDMSDKLIEKIKSFLYSDMSQRKMSDSELKETSIEFLNTKK